MDDGTYGNIMIIMYFCLLALTQKQRRRGEKETQKKKKKKNKAPPPPSSQPTSNTTSDHGRKSTPQNTQISELKFGQVSVSAINFSVTDLCILYRNNPPKKTKQKEVLSWFVLGFRSLCVCIGVGRNAKQSKAKQSKANQSKSKQRLRGRQGSRRVQQEGSTRSRKRIRGETGNRAEK